LSGTRSRIKWQASRSSGANQLKTADVSHGTVAPCPVHALHCPALPRFCPVEPRFALAFCRAGRGDGTVTGISARLARDLRAGGGFNAEIAEIAEDRWELGNPSSSR